MPGALLAPIASRANEKSTRASSLQVEPRHRHSLRDGLRLIRALPGVQTVLVTVVNGITFRRLGTSPGVPGPHAFAVRIQVARHATCPRPSHSIPRSWRSRAAPLLGWNGRIMILIWGCRQVIFLKNGRNGKATPAISLSPLAKSTFARKPPDPAPASDIETAQRMTNGLAGTSFAVEIHTLLVSRYS
jgi:hypothetical protein